VPATDDAAVPDDWRCLGFGARLRWLGWSGCLLLMLCCVLLPAIDVSLRLLGYRRTRRALDWLLVDDVVPAAPAPDVTGDAALRIALIVGIAARKLPWPASCLRQAVLCRALLARRGITCELRIGVELALAGFAAHAWVEQGGRVIIGGEHARDRYRVLL